MRIFLIGFMGSGKTTIGKQLASKLNYTFIDQDTEIEKKFGMSVSEIFSTHGEECFRNAEKEALHSMRDQNNVVISTGGGAPCFFDNMLLMNSLGTTIYLKADPKTLASRLRHSHGTRPLILGKTDAELLSYISEKLNEREPFYSQAKLTVQSVNLRATDLVQILQNLAPPQ